jgi:hypothetical protein
MCPTGLIRKEFGDSKSLERLRQQYPQKSYHNAQTGQKVAVTQESQMSTPWAAQPQSGSGGALR